MKKTIDSTKLYVARVRNIISNDNTSIEMGHYNSIGYRLFYKKNDREYVDILNNIKYPTFSDRLKTGTLFVLNPEPLFHYARSLRIEEDIQNVVKYAKYVDKNFNLYMHNKSKWYAVKDYIHSVHHKDDEQVEI